MDIVVSALKGAEAETIPKFGKSQDHRQDEYLQHLIETKNQAYLNLKYDRTVKDRTSERVNINELRKKIKKRIEKIDTEKANKLADSIEKEQSDLR